MGKDKRRHVRHKETLEIKVSWPEREMQIGRTLNFSDGGTFIDVVFEQQPPVGTEMELQLNGTVRGGEAPVLKARVIWSNEKGIAFSFMKRGE